MFQEGSLVKEGDILFVIEQKRYLATLELREAELESAKASLVRAERDYKRQKSLSSQNYALQKPPWTPQKATTCKLKRQ